MHVKVRGICVVGVTKIDLPGTMRVGGFCMSVLAGYLPFVFSYIANMAGQASSLFNLVVLPSFVVRLFGHITCIK